MRCVGVNCRTPWASESFDTHRTEKWRTLDICQAFIQLRPVAQVQEESEGSKELAACDALALGVRLEELQDLWIETRTENTAHHESGEGYIVSASENADPSRQRAHLVDVRNAHVLVPPAHPRPRLTHPDQTSFQLLVPHHDTFATVSVSGPGAFEFENVVERVDVHGVFCV